MGMVVRTNVMATNANNSLAKNNGSLAKSLEKLSSGFAINRAADDASGLAISEKMKAQIKALDTASTNCEDGISLIQTAEGYMSEVHDMLNRMVELSEKSANGTMETVSGGTTAEAYSGAATDRQALQEEMDQLAAEVDRIAQTANFNNLKLFDGTLDSGVKIGADQKITVSGATATADAEFTYSEADGEWQNGGVTADFSTYGLTAPTDAADGDKIKFTAAKAAVTSPTAATAATVPAGATFNAGNATATEDATLFWDDSASGWKFDDEDGETIDDIGAYGITGDPTGGADATVNFTAAVPVSDAKPASATYEAAAGGTGKSLTLQIGETDTAADKLVINVSKLTTDHLFADIASGTTYTGTGSGLALTAANATSTYADGITVNISNQDAASSAAVGLRNSINAVSSQRAKLGAMQNRMEYTVNNLNTASENMTSANSRIRDTDMAKEMMKYTQSSVLTQAAQAMLAQANTQPQNVLQLLQ